MEIIRSSVLFVILTTLLVSTFCSNDLKKEDDYERLNIIQDILNGYKNKEYLDAFSKTKDVSEPEMNPDEEANDDAKADFDVVEIANKILELRPIPIGLDIEIDRFFTNGKKVTLKDLLLVIQKRLNKMPPRNPTQNGVDNFDTTSDKKVKPEKLKRLNELDGVEEGLVAGMESFKAGMKSLKTAWGSGAEGLKQGLQGLKRWFNVFEKVINAKLKERQDL